MPSSLPPGQYWDARVTVINAGRQCQVFRLPRHQADNGYWDGPIRRYNILSDIYQWITTDTGRLLAVITARSLVEVLHIGLTPRRLNSRLVTPDYRILGLPLPIDA